MRRAPETYAASMSVAGMRERLPLGAKGGKAVGIGGHGGNLCF
jgi:hypothetical protein